MQERPYLPLPDEVADTTKTQIILNTENMLKQTLARLEHELQPSHGAIVFDGGESYWRKQLFADYKANRKPMPRILADALPRLHAHLENLGFSIVKHNDFEADDTIASIATKLAEHGQNVIIASTDKGFLPLLGSHIAIYDPFTREFLSEEYVIKKFGVSSKQLVRYLSLVGDSTNNVPGVEGIGPKGAHDLLSLGITLTDVLEHPDCPKKLKEKVLANKDKIKIFMQVLTLKTDVQLGLNLQNMRLNTQTHV